MAIDMRINQLIDPTGYGISDTKHKIIRALSANVFWDDPRRYLRVFKFMYVGWQLDHSTKQMVNELSEDVDFIDKLFSINLIKSHARKQPIEAYVNNGALDMLIKSELMPKRILAKVKSIL